MAVVLKSGAKVDTTASARGATGLAGFNYSDFIDESRQRLEDCRTQVQQMLKQAEIEAQQSRQQAERKGYEEGLKRAAVDADKKRRAEAEQLAKEQLGLIRSATTQLHQSHEAWMQQYAEVMTTIAIEAAQRIVRHQLEHDKEILVRWADDALRSTRSSSKLILAVHPETLAELGQALDELLASPDLPEQTHVEPDESLAKSDIVVRQAGGDIQAGLQAQLERLTEMLQ